MTKKLLLFAIACLCASVHVHATTYYNIQKGDLRYSVDTETLEASVYAASRTISGDVVIPASIEADPDGVMRTYTVTTIGEKAFEECRSLASVTIPNSVTSIEFMAFYDCSSLTSVAIPNSVTSIGERAFHDCFSLTSVAIPNSVTSIGARAFYNCSSLTSVTIPNSVTSIGKEAFYGCRSLDSVTIPESVTFIGSGAFGNCAGLTSIEVESGNPNYTSDDGILYNKDMTTLLQCPGAKTAVDIPNSVTSIGEVAFERCTSLTSVTIPNSVTSIGDWAFYDCSALTSVTIPNSVTSIGDWAFYYCTSLTSVTIPNSVTSIGSWAFYSCAKIEKIYCMWDTPLTCEGNIWDNATYGKATLYVPIGCVAAYQAAEPWSSFTNIEENPATNPIPTIDNLRYSVNPATLEATVIGTVSDIAGDLVIPATIEVAPDRVMRTYTVTTIGEEVFYLNFDLTSVTIPNSVTTIGDGAFQYCVSLASVTLSESLTAIGEVTFEGCSSLTSITIPNSVTSIGSWAFQSCSSLTSVTLSESLTAIGEQAFWGCIDLASITIPNSVTTIGVKAFMGCRSLTSVAIPESVTSIGVAAFGQCSGLTSIEVESENPNYTSDDGILYNKGMTTLMQCPGTKTAVDIPNSVTSIEIHAFSGCSSLASVTIPESVISIGEAAFVNCSSLTSVVIPNPVTSIGNNAFSFCTSLTSVTLPNSITSIGKQAFKGSAKIEKIYCMWDTPITCRQDVWDNATYGKATLYVPIGCVAAYQAVAPWSLFSKIEEHTITGLITTVGDNAKTVVGIYDINGRKVNAPVDGINIVRYSDGTTRKVVVRNRQ